MSTCPAPLLAVLLLGSAPALAPAPPPKTNPDGGAASPAPEKALADGLSKDVLKKVLDRHQNELRSCYEQALRSKPTLAGKVAVKLIVGVTGDVLDAQTATDTLNDENTLACMLSVVRTWKFPEPAGGGNVTITFPWVFKPAPAAPR